ncbi:MAG: substrate-binding domain-containing protein [Chitinivibrionales bacterium]|nr:substrate-binding domain-containing protein [Chitinivibrionales bacterium]
MKSNIPVVFKAYQFLKDVEENLAAASKDAFPPIRALALRAGVSTMSMQRAVELMKTEGKITVTGKGGGATIQRAHPSFAQNRPGKGSLTIELGRREYRWVKTARLISEDILNGTYKENRRLPTLKELHLRFGDCYYTLVKAMQALSASGLVREAGNGYAVTPLARPVRTTLYLFAHKIILPAHLNIQDERHRDFLRLVEVECKNHSLNLKIAGGDSLDDPEFVREYKGRALGSIVWGAYWENTTFLNTLMSFKHPIAIVDDAEKYRAFIATQHRTHHNLRFFLANSAETAGKNIGGMLLRLGHRKIAFISIYETEPFSIGRLKGLRAALSVDDARNGVTALIAAENEAPWNSPAENHKDRQSWKRLLESAQRVVPLKANKHYLEKLDFTLQTIALEEKHRRLCLPLFKRALADPNITAWVCANDQIAFLAADFLKSKNLHVPADISLVGFDDLFRSFQSNLTSYNFNNPMVVHRIFQHILNPLSDAMTNKNAPVEIPGHIMQRESVGFNARR